MHFKNKGIWMLLLVVGCLASLALHLCLQVSLVQKRRFRAKPTPRNSTTTYSNVSNPNSSGRNWTLKLAPRAASKIRRFEVGLVMPEREFTKKKFTKLPRHFDADVAPKDIVKEFTLSPAFVKESIGGFFFLFFVKSSAGAAGKRNLIRQTWASIQSINEKRIGSVFLVGKTSDQKLQGALLAEQKAHDDLLQSDVEDSYRSLPDKVLSGYQWLSEDVNVSVTFVAFTDDDCMVNVPLVFDYFSTNKDKFTANPSVHCGFRYNEMEAPMRAGKYAISKELYPHDRLPVFCHGGLSVMTYEHMSAIYRKAKVTQRRGLHLEDVYITGILRAKLNSSQSISRVYTDSSHRSVPHYLGLFVWHLLSGEPSRFSDAWRVVFNLMSSTVDGVEIKGFWPSSSYFHARFSGNVVIPRLKATDKYFSENFASYG